MRNRLELARRLLKPEGVICINIGNEEVSYIQVLLDDLFGRDNYINHITMTTNDPSGFKATSSKIFSTSNHLYLYAKDMSSASLNKLFVSKPYDENYRYFLCNPNDNYAKWKYVSIKEALANSLGCKASELSKNYSKEDLHNLLSNFANQNKDRVFRTAAIGGGALAKRKDTVQLSKQTKGVVFKHPNEDVDGFYILNGEGVVFWGNLFEEVDGESVPATALTDVWTDIKWTGIANEGNVKLKNGKKPEKLLHRILSLATKPNDLILDYHLGSGTACAVAHKMGRKWIGIEQLDYGINDSIVRLNNVISGDKSGISKLTKWQGGGSFVYCELAKLNQSFIDEIQDAETEDQLLSLYNKIISTGYISHKVTPADIDTNCAEYQALSFDDKKRFLAELLDKNLLYVNYCDIDDEEYAISEEDKAFTRSFYEVR